MSSTGRSSRPSAGIAAARPHARIAASAGSAGSSGSSVVAFTEQRADLVELLPCGRPRRERSQHQLERGSPEPDRRALARGHRLSLCRALGQPSGLTQQRVRPLPPIATPGGRQTLGELQQRGRSEEHTSELQSQSNLVCRLLLEKKKTNTHAYITAYRNQTDIHQIRKWQSTPPNRPRPPLAKARHFPHGTTCTTFEFSTAPLVIQ